MTENGIKRVLINKQNMNVIDKYIHVHTWLNKKHVYYDKYIKRVYYGSNKQ